MEGNLFSNPSFASGSGPVATGWDLFNGAARQLSGAEAGEYARTGAHFLELDSDEGSPHDLAQQSVELPLLLQGIGKRFLLQFWHAKNDAKVEKSAKIRVRLQELNDIGVPVHDLEYAIDEVITINSRMYQEFRRLVTTRYEDTRALQLTLQWVKPDGSTGDDVFVDDCYLFPADELVNEGWNANQRGDAEADVDWANEEEPFHGSYCVRVTTSGTDGTAANSVRIHPTKDKWSQTRDKTQHVVKVRVRGAAGQKLRLGLQRQGEGGGADYGFASEVALAGTGDWETVTATLSSAGKTAIRPIIELRSNGTYYLDAVEVYEAGIEIPDRKQFLDGENLVYTYRVGDYRGDLAVHASDNKKVKSSGLHFTAGDVGRFLVILSGSGWTPGKYKIHAFDGEYVTLYDTADETATSPAAAGTVGGIGVVTDLPNLSARALQSIHTYGLREEVVQVEEIQDLARAAAYATGYLNRRAVPQGQGRLTLDRCEVPVRYVSHDALATPQGMVRIGGLATPVPDQFPARISYSMEEDGALRCELDLTTMRPELGLLLAQALGKERSSGGGGGGAGTNLSNGSGGSFSGGDEGTAASYYQNGVRVGSRGSVDLKAGTGITIAAVDNETDGRIEYTLSATGSTPAAAVTDETAFGQSSAVGTSTDYARADHTHGTPADPIPAHVAAADPHPQYQKESEKAAASGYASLDSTAKVPTAQLGSGTASSSVFLRGDQTWAAASGTSHTLLGSMHSDTDAAATPATGDLVYRNASVWTRLAIGTAGYFLQVVSGAPAWVQLAFSRLTGSLGAGQHGSLSDGDHTGNLTGNARVGVRVNTGATTYLRRRLNLIPGSSRLTISHADASGTEEVNVTLDAAAQDPTVGGDLSGTASNATVAKIQGKTTPLPGFDDDGSVLRYQDATDSFVLARVNSLATASAALQYWRRNNVQNAQTTKGEAPGLEGATTGCTMFKSGKIVGVSIDLDGDVGAGATYEAEAYLRTAGGSTYSATGALTTLSSGKSSYAAVTPVAFSAGDTLTIFDKKSGSPSSRNAKITIFVVLD